MTLPIGRQKSAAIRIAMLYVALYIYPLARLRRDVQVYG